ncbi:Mf family protein [Megaselia abdita]
MFKQHLEMIGRNETPSKKAKFWQSYIRSLKGSEDIRAHETPKARPYSSYLDAPSTYRSIFDEPSTTRDRVESSGYRYLPVHRDTYGYSPRAIYDHHYSRSIPANYDAEKAWNDHLKRMQEIERRYPSRYGLYLKDKPTAPNALVPLEYEPEDKLLQELSKGRSGRSVSPGATGLVPVFDRAGSLPPRLANSRALSLPPVTPAGRCLKVEPQRYYPFSYRGGSIPRDNLSKLNELSPIAERASVDRTVPTPIKPSTWAPRPNEIAFDEDGLPLSARNPLSAFTHDPFWYDMEDFVPPRLLRAGSPLVRDSFLSPVKNNYLWSRHPARPLLGEEELI